MVTMDTSHRPQRDHLGETPAEQQLRHAWEHDRIAEALADAAAGRVVSQAAVNAWIDSLGTDHELPVPTAGQ